MFSYIIPTRDRPETLAQTLRALGNLPAHDAEVVIVDNASSSPVAMLLQDPLGDVRDGRLINGISVRVVRSEVNLAAAGRTIAVRAADVRSEWIVMLDDDSWPTDLGFQDAIRDASADVGAIAGEIHLLSGVRESGGLPEVFTGCGAIIRRAAYLAAGGYDPAFGYYAEEYDLAARFILAGLRIKTDRRARFVHAKVQAGRDMNTILGRLVRNNGWVMQRYAPDEVRRDVLRATVDRYARIARKEFAIPGYTTGLSELLRTLRTQPRTPMTAHQWDRFTGKAAARRGLLRAWASFPGGAGFGAAALAHEGKNVEIIRDVLEELGVRIVTDERAAEALIIGTLSPGPMWDALEHRADGAAARTSGSTPLIAPWRADGHAAPEFTRSVGITQRCA